MSVIDELITDRTQQDVDYIKSLNKKGWSKMSSEEKLYYIKGLIEKLSAEDGELYAEDGLLSAYDGSTPKGAYNAKDLNRVEEAIEYLVGRLLRAGYSLNIESESWCLGDIPPVNQWQLYLNRVRIIKNSIANLPTTPALPLDMQGLTYEEANAIEQILIDVDKVITLSELTHCYSGEIYAGEENA